MKLVRLLILLLLMTMGTRETLATVGIKSLGYKTDFASTSEPFNKGDIVTTNANIGSVLRVFNTTSRAYFNDVHTLRTNETVTISFTAYHGYLGSTNKTSSVSVLNSNGVVLIGYTYNHTSGRITDVKIGGSTVLGFEEFDAISHYNSDQNANGIDGNGKPYRNGSGTYNPKITMQISENGTVMFNLYLSNKAIDKTIWSNIGSAAKNLGCIEITSNCDNSDRTICIDDLEISTNYYSQNYDSETIDWTTANSDRFTPVILDEGGNKYLSVDQGTRNNNGTVLTRPSFNIAEGTDYNMSFDLKVSSSTNQEPVSFTVYDKLGSDVIFSLTATGTWSTDWKVNNGTQINLPNTNKGNSSNTITDVPWYTISLTRRGATTHVTIKNKEGATTYFDSNVTSSSSGGLGKMEFNTCRYFANFAIDNVEITPLPTWSASSATVDITDVGASDPNVVADYLPYLKEHRYEISTYSSSNTNVASFWPGNQLLIKGIGATTITATDTQGNSASYNLTVTGTMVAPVINGNMLTFSEPGIIMNNTENTTKSHTLPKGLTVSYGFSNGSIGETAIVVSSESGSVLKVIDNNGYSRPNIGGNGVPYEGIYGGTFVKLEASSNGYMVLTGNVSAARSRLVKSDGTVVDTEIDESDHTLAASLASGSTYYLYNLRLLDDATDGVIVPLVNSISYVDAYFKNHFEVINIPANGETYSVQSVKGMTFPTYSISCVGDVGTPTITGTTISGITGGGAIKITATEGNASASYVLTVAYDATAYPGHLWDFYSAEKGLTTTDAMKEVPDPSNESTKYQTGYYGDSWRAEYKNVNNNERPEWYRQDAVYGDNAFIVPETAGLVFVNNPRNFFLRNDANTYSHIGIRGNGGGTSFTIPLLKEGDIVEILWRHESAGSGSVFEATNLKDLRGKTISEEFEITESAYRRIRNYVGPYSFVVVADGDVTFTLKDYGNNDIQSIRIYSGDYIPTMRRVNLLGNVAAPTTLLLDNREDGYTYTYCNQLYSTATGPAMYVLKGYAPGRDDILSVQGADAADEYNFRIHTDENAYPVPQEESDRLYEMRKNLVGFKMYNTQWKRGANYPTYNYGHIDATSGWGKVTIRMNNYTADMKYLIGYTPDYTLTIGSAPHQTYPYTWDFTNISAQKERGKPTNVYNTIINKDQNDTNWDHTSNGVFSLNTNNVGQFDSQYVPGAVLVTTDRALSNIEGVSSDPGDKYALDEFDGIGIDGIISFDSDSKPSTRNDIRTRASSTISLLSFTMDDYKEVKTTEVVDGETIVTEWKNATGVYLPAGNGWVKFGMDKIEDTDVATCGFAYKCDRDASSGNGIYLRPERSLQAGDVITVKVYATSVPTAEKPFGLGLYEESGTTPYDTQFIPNGLKNSETKLTFTVPESMKGMSTICLYRESNSVYLTEVQITGSASSEPVRRELFCETETTITIPDLNKGVQDWIYVSASEAPTTVINATMVESGPDGPDANTNVYKYKVATEGNAYLTFPVHTRIYKIGVTHILKEIHPVGGVGWATESRNHHIDHSLIGYFTKNDVNAYTVRYDSYDMKTATVALTPINEDGYVPEKTGIVMKLDNTENLSDANSGKYVPLFYPSYTLGASSTAVNFPDNNWMYQKEEDIDRNNRNYREVFDINSINYTKFILTNKYWTFNKDHAPNTDESAESHTADAAGFYRMHIWKTTGDADEGTKNTMPSNSAFLLVPSDNLPVAVWTLQSGYSAARGDLLGVYNIIGPGSETAIEDVRVTPEFMVNDYNADGEETWYTVSGMKLSTRPTQPGLYIYNNRKVVIK